MIMLDTLDVNFAFDQIKEFYCSYEIPFIPSE
jgi:hypothetical protein